jgi:hypothetical protein
VVDKARSSILAVGSFAFVENVKSELGAKDMHGEVIQAGGNYELREPTEAYAGKFTGKNEVLSAENTVLWNESVENARTDGHSFDRRKEGIILASERL